MFIPLTTFALLTYCTTFWIYAFIDTILDVLEGSAPITGWSASWFAHICPIIQASALIILGIHPVKAHVQLSANLKDILQ